MTPSELKAKGLAVRPLEWVMDALGNVQSFDDPPRSIVLRPFGRDGMFKTSDGTVAANLMTAKHLEQVAHEARICAALTEVK